MENIAKAVAERLYLLGQENHMLKIALILSLTLTSFWFSSSASADEVTPEAYKAALLELNRNPVTQNPDYSLGRQVVKRRLLDKNNRAIGKINDIILMPNGKFKSIEANITTAGFREDVGFNVESYVTDPTDSSFTIAMDKTQINQNMAQLMADIETSSGPDAPLTLNSLRGANIVDPKGMAIAKIEDAVVIDKQGLVQALLVRMSAGKNRGSVMAIPYEAAEVRRSGARTDFVLREDQVMSVMSLSKPR